MKILIQFLALAAVALADDAETHNLLKNGNDKFTSLMTAEVVKSNPGKSVVMSAFSVLSPLAELSLASEGSTHDELLNAIGLPNDNVTKSVFSSISNELKNVQGVELKIASKIYVKEGAALNDEFAVLTKEVFNSELQNIDFTKNKEASEQINAWVEDNTNHRIKNLVSPDMLTPMTVSVLVNSIFFKGSWKSKFDKDVTTDRDFHVTKDITIKVPTMYQRNTYKYGDSGELDAQLIELPYEGDQSSFFIVLPKKVDGINDLIQKLKDPEALAKAERGMYKTEVDLFLPKFKIETKTKLKDVLQNIGVKGIFEPTAQITRLLKDSKQLYVSDAVQKAFIEVNEEGAEAAAANAFAIVGYSMIIKATPMVNINKPFYFELRHNNLAIFNGVFVKNV